MRARRLARGRARRYAPPAVAHFDGLGAGSIYAIAGCGGGERAAVRSESDLTGRSSRLFDRAAAGEVAAQAAPSWAWPTRPGRR